MSKNTTTKLTLTVEMEVTPPQALALQAMFKYWNYLSHVGSSRNVAFRVDGDGNFHPKCTIYYSGDPLPDLTEELEELAVISDRGGNRVYDFDPIAWKIQDPNPPLTEGPTKIKEFKDNKEIPLSPPPSPENHKTMDEMYGDGSNHFVCEKCELCIKCGDCQQFGCGAENE